MSQGSLSECGDKNLALRITSGIIEEVLKLVMEGNNDDYGGGGRWVMKNTSPVRYFGLDGNEDEGCIIMHGPLPPSVPPVKRGD